jgi:hypothetical protein
LGEKDLDCLVQSPDPESLSQTTEAVVPVARAVVPLPDIDWYLRR